MDLSGSTLPGPPITLNQPPVSIHQHSVPRVLESLRVDLHARLVTDTLRVTFDLDTRQSGVTETKLSRVKKNAIYRSSLNSFHQG